MPLGGTWTEQDRPGLLLVVPLPLIGLDLLGSSLSKSLYVAHRQTNSTAKESKSSRRNLANFTHDSQSLRLAQVRLAGYPSRTSRVPDASTCRHVGGHPKHRNRPKWVVGRICAMPDIDPAFFSIESSRQWPTLRTAAHRDNTRYQRRTVRCNAMREIWGRTVAHLNSETEDTSFQRSRWVRFRRPDTSRPR